MLSVGLIYTFSIVSVCVQHLSGVSLTARQDFIFFYQQIIRFKLTVTLSDRAVELEGVCSLVFQTVSHVGSTGL